MFAVIFVLAATLTLLPAVLGRRSGRRSTSSRCRGRTPASTTRPLPEVGRAALAPAGPSRGASRSRSSSALAIPVTQLGPRCRRSRSSPPATRPDRLPAGPASLRSRRDRPAADRRPGRRCRGRTADRRRRSRVSPRLMPTQTRTVGADHRDPEAGPVQPGGRSRRSTGCGSQLRRIADRRRRRREPRSPGRAVGEDAARDRRHPGARVPAPADRAPGALVAAVGVFTNLLASGAAFGVAKLVFQDGHLHSLLGFQPQGFLDAWGPVFFFAMIFAISMDYTVFLLSAAKEHWDHTRDPKQAMVGALAHSGRVIFAAGGGDGRGVLHVRALRAAAAKGDGRHPRRRGAARRRPDPAPAAPGPAAPDGPPRVVPAAVGCAGSCPTSRSATHDHRPTSRCQRRSSSGRRCQRRSSSGKAHYAEPPEAQAQRAKAATAKRKELEKACPELMSATR